MKPTPVEESVEGQGDVARSGAPPGRVHGPSAGTARFARPGV